MKPRFPHRLCLRGCDGHWPAAAASLAVHRAQGEIVTPINSVCDASVQVWGIPKFCCLFFFFFYWKSIERERIGGHVEKPPPPFSLSLDPNVVIHFAWSCCCCWATCPCPASAVVSFSVSPPLSSCCFVWFPAVCLSVRPLRPSFNSSLLRTYIRSDTVRNRLTVVDPLVNQKSLIEELYLQRIARTTRLICRSYFNGLSAAFPLLLHLHFSPSPSSFYFIWNPHLSRTTAAATVPVESTRRLICFYDVSNPDER